MTDTGKLVVIATLVITFILFYLLAPILTPFMMAAVLAYMGDPLVDRLEAWKLSRTWAVVVVFVGLSLVALILLLILVPMLHRQIGLLIEKVPVYLDWLQHTALPWLSARLGLEAGALDLSGLKASLQSNWQQAGSLMTGVLAAVSKSGLALAGWLANLVLVPVVTFYLLRDWDILVARIRDLLPRRVEPVVSKLARESDDVLGAFFRGQLLVMLALAAVYTIGLKIVGLELALLIGLLAGLVSFVPYLGFIVGILAAGIAALMQFQDPTVLAWVALVFGIGQALEGMVLTPLLVGDRIGLHPVAVIFAVLAGGQLFGFLGVLLALPVGAVIVVLLRHAHDEYLRSAIYGGDADT
ncbi:MAG TPA: AI-2E family transporter [Gammaproteobacteria bacterium]|nr:AI-2E family transporter [Gammaproteobacteria bacterium]